MRCQRIDGAVFYMQLPVVGVVNKGVTGQGGVAHGVEDVLLEGLAVGA